VRQGIIDFRFECLVLPFKFRKMHLHGHVASLLGQLAI
jgi:hypothetical protein